MDTGGSGSAAAAAGAAVAGTGSAPPSRPPSSPAPSSPRVPVTKPPQRTVKIHIAVDGLKKAVFE
eukprot:5268548-Pyramimonas_sp.AAC.1